MEDAVLSTFLQVMLQTIVTLIANEIGLQHDVRNGLERLKDSVERIGSILSDADGGENASETTEAWLRQLRDLAYDVNNLLDVFRTEIKRRSSIRLQQVRNSLSLVNPKRALFRHELADGIKGMEEKIDAIARESGLNLRVRRSRAHRRDQGLSSSVGIVPTDILGGSTVYGRDNDIAIIVDLLATEGNTFCNPSVLPIQGMGGIGKSTLAREVFNHELIQSHFKPQMWVHVSRTLDIVKLMRSIIMSIDGDATPPQLGMWDLNHLQRGVRDRLSGKKYLLVLDDMWSERSTDWEVICIPLRVGARGSWIIVTSRSKTVAKIVGTMQPRCLEGLSDGDCWQVFYSQAFEDKTEMNNSPELTEIGYKIATKCKGSPLAAKVLGSQLRSENDSKQWQSVLESQLPDNTEILQTLQVSYNHLPAHIKQCFRYCSTFPKGFKFQRDVLVQLWMAQDFIIPVGTKSIEDIGNGYFTNLLQSSLLQQVANETSMFVMHDLIHDLAQHVSRYECCIIEHGKENSFPEKVRHSLVLCKHVDPKASSSSSHYPSSSPICIEPAYKYKDLNTLILLSNSRECLPSLPNTLHRHFKYLRTLDLSNSGIRNLEDGISNLKHLRYLNFSNTEIEKLPKSLNDIYNLQSLLLRNCYKLVNLPRHMANLRSLRHLDLHLDTDFTKVGCLNSMPEDIGKLTQLQTLSRFILSKKNKHGGIHELKDLNELHGDLEIINLQMICSVEEAKSANLGAKNCISRLKLQWTDGNDGSLPRQNTRAEDKDILPQLKPHKQLEELWIEGYSGMYLPSWINGSHFVKLVSFTLSNCKNCKWLPCLGQLPCLKELCIRGLQSVESLDCKFCGKGPMTKFPSLKKLEFENMLGWKTWSGARNCKFPFLRELIIKGCPELSLLTHNLPLLNTLVVEGCPQLLCLDGLPSLRSLDVKASGEWIWSQWPFFASLVSLTLAALPTEIPLMNLTGCISLRHVKIIRCDNIIFLPDDFLPIQLIHLVVGHCSQIQALPNGLSNSALEEIEVKDCQHLMSLPEGFAKLKSLEVLEIADCPKLLSLPDDGLPTTLQVFSIKNCPLLRQKCHQNGEEWPKIEHIPLVCIDDEHIYSAKQY